MKNRLFVWVGIVTGLLIIPFGSSAETTSPATNEPQISAAVNADYQIGASDVLEIITWKEKEFSKVVLVRTDGKITFPLIDDVPAAGLSPMMLKQDIENRLKRYLSNPVVTVTVNQPNSKQFYILGEVVRANQYPLNKDTTLLQAIAIAGGFTEWAAKRDLVVIRQENGKELIIRINYHHIIKNNDYSQNLLLRENDTIIVP